MEFELKASHLLRQVLYYFSYSTSQEFFKVYETCHESSSRRKEGGTAMDWASTL
jgi:hypothetical protein